MVNNFIIVHCYNYSVLLFKMVVNLLLCLIYKVKCVCIGKSIVHIGFGIIHAFEHL